MPLAVRRWGGRPVAGQGAGDRSVGTVVASLLDKSLVQHSLDVQGADRFDMLATIRQFAAAKLREAGQAEAARERHLAYFLDMAERADSQVHGPDQVYWNDLLEIEHDNLRLALDYCLTCAKTDAALHLFAALSWPWRTRDHAHEFIASIDRVRALPKAAAYPILFGRVLNEAGIQRWLMGDLGGARGDLEESRALLAAAGPDAEPELASTLTSLGILICFVDSDYGFAERLFRESLELDRGHGDENGRDRALFNLGWVAALSHRNDTAITLLEESLAIYERRGDLWGVARVSQRLGEVYIETGEFETARRFLQQHLAIDERLHYKQGVVIALLDLGDLCRHEGDYACTRQLYERGLRMARESGLSTEQEDICYYLGLVALHEDDYLLAAQILRGRPNVARARAGKLRAHDFLVAAAAVAAGTHQPECAAQPSGAAQAIMDSSDICIPPFDRCEFDRHLALAPRQIGDEAFAAWSAEGRKMTVERAVVYGLDHLRSAQK